MNKFKNKVKKKYNIKNKLTIKRNKYRLNKIHQFRMINKLYSKRFYQLKL